MLRRADKRYIFRVPLHEPRWRRIVRPRGILGTPDPVEEYRCVLVQEGLSKIVPIEWLADDRLAALSMQGGCKNLNDRFVFGGRVSAKYTPALSHRPHRQINRDSGFSEQRSGTLTEFGGQRFTR